MKHVWFNLIFTPIIFVFIIVMDYITNFVSYINVLMLDIILVANMSYIIYLLFFKDKVEVINK